MANLQDLAYLEVVEDVLAVGARKGDRTGTGTLSLFARQMMFDMDDGFPLLTAKKTPFRWVAEELFWFIEGGHDGGMNNEVLKAKGVDIWTPWAAPDGHLGPVYGYQWRNWPRYEHRPGGEVYRTGGYDQLGEVEQKLRTNPDDRRMIVSAWNVDDIDDMALPPCHLLFQFWSEPLSVDERRSLYRAALPDEHAIMDVEGALDMAGVPSRRLHLQMYQRSCDLFIGVPFNIAQYSLLLHLMAHATNHRPGVFTWLGGDCHIYANHIQQVEEMLDREPYPAPTLSILGPSKALDDYSYTDLQLDGYQCHPKIDAPVAV